MKPIYILIASFCYFLTSYAQTGKIEGKVLNSITNEPVPFANVLIWQTSNGTVCDVDGKFILAGLKPGYIKLSVSSIGFITNITEDIFITNSETASIEVMLNESTYNLKETTVKASPYRKTSESPLSLQTINLTLNLYEKTLCLFIFR